MVLLGVQLMELLLLVHCELREHSHDLVEFTELIAAIIFKVLSIMFIFIFSFMMIMVKVDYLLLVVLFFVNLGWHQHIP